MNAIEVRGLVKRYGDTIAVDGVDLEIREGEVFALLGPNGAGKTTTVEILEGYRSRDAGEARVLGHDPAEGSREFMERIGIVLQETSVEPELTVAEALEIYGSIYPRRRDVDELVELVGLSEKRDARVKTLSGGQRRRLELALGIVGDPELLFLDEPTTGFDPSARRQAWTVIENLRALGKTILLTTHYMDEAQHLADRVAVIARGRIIAEGTPETIGGRDDTTTIRFRVAGVALDDLPLVPTRLVDGRVEIASQDPTRDLYTLTRWAVDREIRLEDLEVVRPSLEDVYLELTGGEGAP